MITGLAPVDTSSPQALATTVAQRQVQAQTVSTWAGVPVSPLTEQETVGVKGMLDALPAKERSGAVAAIAQALGPQAAAGLARQIDPKDKALALAFGYGGAATTAGRNVSELILRGEQARKDGTSTKNEKAAALPAAQWERFMATEIADLYPVQTLADDARHAALLIAHGMAAEQGGALSEADMQRAVRMAVGGPVIEHNGRRIPLPAGMTADALRQRLQSVDLQPQTGGQGVIAAGVRVPTAEFAKHLPGQQLIYAGPGRYNVLVGGRPVTNAQGRRIVIGVQ